MWRYTEAQIRRRGYFFPTIMDVVGLVSPSTSAKIVFRPKVFYGISVESVGRALVLFSYAMIADLVFRWNFWRTHPHLRPLVAPAETTELEKPLITRSPSNATASTIR
jgi:hypothetical protein